jgi:hypothetical protein
MRILHVPLLLAATTAALIAPPVGALAQVGPPPALAPQPQLSLEPSLKPLAGPSLSDLPPAAPVPAQPQRPEAARPVPAPAAATPR